MNTIQHAHAGPVGAETVNADIVSSTHAMLRYLFAVVPVVAGADKFFGLLASWEAYLNPLILKILPVTAHGFMLIVGVIEMVAGVLVFVKPRLGGFVVMGWLFAIALQLIAMGSHLDIAVRDIVIALAGPFVLARFTPLVSSGETRSADSN